MTLQPTTRRPHRRQPIAGVAAVILLAGACTDPASTPALGVEEWTVAGEPSVVIGATEGDSAYLFQRVVDAALLVDGGIVVGDRGLSVLRVYAPDGTFRSQMGGRGRGPGEFIDLSALWTTGDTIVAWDSEILRVTYFRPDGTLVRTASLETSMEASGVGHLDLVVGPLGDGTLALGSLTAGTAEGAGRDRISVERFGPDGEHRERIGEVTGFIRGRSGPGPFTPYPYFATHGDVVYFTNGEAPTVQLWDLDGPDPKRVSAVLTLPPAHNDPDAAWDALPTLLEERGDDSSVYFLEQTERSDSIPHLAGLVVDDRGRAWSKAYEAPLDGLWLDGGPRVRGGRWWVADPGEGVVAAVEVPDGLVLLGVEGDRAMGLTVDELGVERIQIHAIRRSPGAVD